MPSEVREAELDFGRRGRGHKLAVDEARFGALEVGSVHTGEGKCLSNCGER